MADIHSNTALAFRSYLLFSAQHQYWATDRIKFPLKFSSKKPIAVLTAKICQSGEKCGENLPHRWKIQLTFGLLGRGPNRDKDQLMH